MSSILDDFGEIMGHARAINPAMRQDALEDAKQTASGNSTKKPSSLSSQTQPIGKRCSALKISTRVST